MEKYTDAEIVIIQFDAEDVITTSTKNETEIVKPE